MSKYKFITIIGNVATGKSTLTQLLSDALPAQKIPADDFYLHNPFFPLAVEDRYRWSLASDLWFLKERTKMALDTEKYLTKSHVVVDSGLPMTQVYTHSRLGSGFFTSDEWNLYQECYDVFTREVKQPDLIIYLTAPVEVQHERIKQRGREFEIKNHTREYISGLQGSLEHIVKEIEHQGVEVIRVDTTITNYFDDQSALENLIKQMKF